MKIMFSRIKKLFDELSSWQESKALFKWIFNIGKDFKRYVLGFLVINLVTMLISIASAIAGRYVVDAATSFRTELFFKYIVIMLILHDYYAPYIHLVEQKNTKISLLLFKTRRSQNWMPPLLRP